MKFYQKHAWIGLPWFKPIQSIGSMFDRRVFVSLWLGNT
jgi:hypothetical protein